MNESQSPTTLEAKKPRVPPGQVITRGWPILHAGGVPNISLETWSLKVYGEVSNPITLSYSQLQSLKRTRITCDIHCVTTWSKLGMEWEGVKFEELMQLVQPTPKAHFALFECEQGFTTSLPLEALLDEDVLIAFRAENMELEAVHGGPVRMLVPKRYFYKSAKWLRGIKLLEEDKPGFWEVRGYSNTADPWNEERYAGVDYLSIVKNRIKAYARGKKD